LPDFFLHLLSLSFYYLTIPFEVRSWNSWAISDHALNIW